MFDKCGSSFSNLKIKKSTFSTTVSLIVKHVAGDGKDEEVAAKTMNFPFWRINAHSDLIAFYNALDMGYM